jgi:hypothetical protein
MVLPLILAGPILRRVDAKLCTVFVALSRDATVEVKLWSGAQRSTGIGTVETGMGPLANVQVQTRKFGEKLHIAMASINMEGPPAVAMAPGMVHSYDVVIDGSENLRSLKLLRDETAASRIDGVHASAPLHLALGYRENMLPGFVSPAATLQDLKLAHASCRRPNFKSYDAMGWLDDQMDSGKDDRLAKWPQQLFLTGDQIYADDVAGAHLHMLGNLGQQVIGGVEKLPIDGQRIDLTVANFPPLRRGITIRQHARFTTTESASHLMSFGEFAAMYLCAWSARVWQPLATDAELFNAALPPAAARPYATDFAATYTGGFSAWRDDGKVGLKAAQDQRAAVEEYRSIVPKVARVLANVSTYMIWDDHEVTDDWNLTGKWVSRVYSQATGQAIIRNGMMAYGLFQGWGNDPQAFTVGNNKDFLDEAAAITAAITAGTTPLPDARMQELLGFPGAGPANRMKFHYQVDGRCHRAVVIDTRTRRDQTLATSVRPPKLLGDTLDEQVPTGPLANGLELLLLVSPAPVLGPSLIDDVMQPAAARLKDAANAATALLRDINPAKPTTREELDALLTTTAGNETVDVEGWSGDDAHREALLKKLAGYNRAVILSGDVHYACTLAMDYWRNGTATPSRIVQLTSSGARNGWPVEIEGLFRKQTVLQDMLSRTVVERVAWNGPAKVRLPPNALVGPGRRSRMQRSPALLPATGWPLGTIETTPADWRWRVRIVADTRATGSGGRPPPPAVVPPTDIGTTGSITANFDAYVATAVRHQLATMLMPRLIRTMVFISNLGLIGFRADGGNFVMTHSLLSSETPSSQRGAANTVHEASLAPTGAPPMLRLI